MKLYFQLVYFSKLKGQNTQILLIRKKNLSSQAEAFQNRFSQEKRFMPVINP